jgi:hypothetical protein
MRPSHIRLPDFDLRELFAVSGLEKAVETGRLLPKIKEDHTNYYDSSSGRYVGWARSVMTLYFDDQGIARAYTHQLLRLDGEPITRPDPKWLRVDYGQTRRPRH